MIDIENRAYMPSMNELYGYVDNPVFTALCEYIVNEYSALGKVEYSGDKILLGWNVKFKKAGRTLCTVYPRQGHFMLLLVIGQKEKGRVEELLPTLSAGFQTVYHDTKEGMGQRWLLFEFNERNDTYLSVLQVVRIRTESK